jgi:hypothetical protein
MQIKYIARVLSGTSAPPPGEKRPFYDYLLSALRDRSDMVTFQAARTIAELKEVSLTELTPAISALQLYLSSGKSVLRFAAVRILNAVSMTQPVAGSRARWRWLCRHLLCMFQDGHAQGGPAMMAPLSCMRALMSVSPCRPFVPLPS